jgi:ribosomal protein L1
MFCLIGKASRGLMRATYRPCAATATASAEITTETASTRAPRKPVIPPNKNLGNQNIHDAFGILKQQARVRFDETVELAIKLNVDPRKQTQAVKGMASLPQGLGKKIRVAVFASGTDIDIAKKAGADYAGVDDLIQMVQGGNTPFDRVVATPDMMAKLSKVGKV